MADDFPVAAHPLHWPPFIPRRASYQRIASKFNKKETANDNRVVQRAWRTSEAHEAVRDELARLGAIDVTISTDVPTDDRGRLRRETVTSDDPGAAVWFRRSPKGPRYVLTCDTYLRVACNLRAIASTIEHLRGIERHGSTQLLERAFEGFAALPPGQTGIPPWREVFGIEEMSPTGSPAGDLEYVNRLYNRLIVEQHSDKTGNTERHVMLNEALRRAKSELERGIT